MDSPAPLCAHWKKSHCLPFWKLQVKKFRPLLGPSFRTVLIKQRFPWWQIGKCKSAHCDREKQQQITLNLNSRVVGLMLIEWWSYLICCRDYCWIWGMYSPRRSCICSPWEANRRRTAVLYSCPACEPLSGLLDDDGMYNTARFCCCCCSPFVATWQSERRCLHRSVTSTLISEQTTSP